MEPMKPLGKTQPGTCLLGSWKPYLVDEEDHFQADSGTTRYFWDLKRGNNPHLQVLESDLAQLLALKGS